MPTKTKTHTSKAIQIAFLFCSVVVLLISMSLLIKLWMVISRSHFDGYHQFIVHVRQTDQKSKVIIFAPDSRAVSILTLMGQDASLPTESIEIPVDASVSDDISSAGKTYLRHILLDSVLGRKTTLTFLDVIRLLMFVQTVSSDKMIAKDFHLPMSPNGLDERIGSLATDQTLYKEGLSVAIVNASSILGKGNEVAKILTHLGGNVISVTTAENTQATSTLVYTDKKSYTSKRIGEILHLVPNQTSKAGIADITLTLGQDVTKGL